MNRVHGIRLKSIILIFEERSIYLLTKGNDMDQITKDRFFELFKHSPKRKCFSETGIQENKKDGSKTFSVRFGRGLKLVYERMTGNHLVFNSIFNNYYHFIDSEKELLAIKNWEKKMGKIVFLYDCLTISIACDVNFVDNKGHKYTIIGGLENEAKYHHHETSVRTIVKICKNRIQKIPFYQEIDYICSIPPRPGKDFDLPLIVANQISEDLEIQNITNGFHYQNKKNQLKETALEDKWDEWENSGLEFSGPDLGNKTILLIDDKYQSGVSLNFVAMKLQMAGASKIFGLCLMPIPITPVIWYD